MCVGVAHWIVLIMLGLVVQISGMRWLGQEDQKFKACLSYRGLY